jgi:beta-phosphoglucomutase-like phosphatase (HAD superfamily)
LKIKEETMTKLCIVDLDGVVADATARFAKAEEAKRNAMPDNLDDALTLTKEQEREITNLYWRTVFDPEYVPLDILIDGAAEAIEAIGKQGYTVFILTSRPESMRQATVDWFWSFSPETVILSNEWNDPLIMKPSAAQYIKTVTWKALTVQMLSRLFHASQVLVVDDEQSSLDEIVRHATIPPVVPGLMIAHSLAEAVAKLNGTWEEPDPFLPLE